MRSAPAVHPVAPYSRRLTLVSFVKGVCTQLSQSKSVRLRRRCTLHVGWFPIDRLSLRFLFFSGPLWVISFSLMFLSERHLLQLYNKYNACSAHTVRSLRPTLKLPRACCLPVKYNYKALQSYIVWTLFFFSLFISTPFFLLVLPSCELFPFARSLIRFGSLNPWWISGVAYMNDRVPTMPVNAFMLGRIKDHSGWYE